MGTHRFARYVVRQLPGWGVAALVLLWLNALVALPAWVAAAFFALFVAKDLALYPFMARVFEPAPRDLVGARARSVERLAPEGYVRVNGELWRARLGDDRRELPAGSTVIVRETRGLTLIVDACE